MPSYQITALKDAAMSSDRQRFSINVGTDKGPITLIIKADHLAALIAALQGLESRASLFEPASGPKPGEPVQLHVEVVDYHHIGIGEVNGTPSVVLGLRSGPVSRWYGLDALRAAGVRDALAAEIRKLQDGRRRN